MLRRDIDVQHGIDIYHEGHNLQEARLACDSHESVLLIGYSLGGCLIADLSCVVHNIRAAVLYESALGQYGRVDGDFPVLIVWNKHGRHWWPKASKMEQAWQERGRPVSFIRNGAGRHIGRDQDGKPCHGWDKSLNGEIFKWVSRFS